VLRKKVNQHRSGSLGRCHRSPDRSVSLVASRTSLATRRQKAVVITSSLVSSAVSPQAAMTSGLLTPHTLVSKTRFYAPPGDTPIWRRVTPHPRSPVCTWVRKGAGVIRRRWDDLPSSFPHAVGGLPAAGRESSPFTGGGRPAFPSPRRRPACRRQGIQPASLTVASRDTGSRGR
jgi:hypothetical protein